MTPLQWKPASVGCHWHAGDFWISTVVMVRGGQFVTTFPDSHYALLRKGEALGKFKTLKAAQRAAERFVIATEQTHAAPSTTGAERTIEEPITE